MAILDMALPAGKPLYAVSSRYFPWTEVYADLEQRAEFSGVLAWGRSRFWWSAGQPLGGHNSMQHFQELPELAQMQPQGLLTLVQLSPESAELASAAERAEAGPLLPWATAQKVVGTPGFLGAVLSPGRTWLWQRGQQLGNLPLPAADDTVMMVRTEMQLSPDDLVGFWNEALRLCAAAVRPDHHWQSVAVRLAERHACLDPFAQEVVVRGGAFELQAEVPVSELQPALRDAMGLLLARAQLSAHDPVLATLNRHPLWEASGAGDLP